MISAADDVTSEQINTAAVTVNRKKLWKKSSCCWREVTHKKDEMSWLNWELFRLNGTTEASARISARHHSDSAEVQPQTST